MTSESIQLIMAANLVIVAFAAVFIAFALHDIRDELRKKK